MNINKNLKQEFILLELYIRKLREERGLSIEGLSLKSGIRKKYLQKIEDGLAYGVLLHKHLFKIAKILNVKFAVLFKYK